MNDLAIVLAMGIDKSEKGYHVSVQIINPDEIASETQTSETSVTTYSTSSETVFEAMKKLTQQVPGKLYFAHLRVVIFGEEIAKTGIRKPLDFLSRDHEMRTDFYILVAKNSRAEPLLHILTSLERIPANSIFDSLEMSAESWAPTKAVTLDELITNLVKEGKHPVLTGIYVQGDEEIGNRLENKEKIKPSAIIHLDHLAVFHNDKLIGWLNQDESKGYNYILDNVKRTTFNVPCGQEDAGKLTLEVMRTSGDMKASIKNGEPKIDINVTVEANVGDIECIIDIKNPKKIRALEKEGALAVEERIVKALKKAQNELQSDIFGFGAAIHRSEMKAWKSLKNDWDEHFPDVSVKNNIEFTIRRLGTTNESFQDVDKKEH